MGTSPLLHMLPAAQLTISQLVAHGRIGDARTILWRLQKNARSITQDHAVINAEMYEIEHALEEERAAAGGTSFLALFKSSPQRFRRRTLLGIGGQFMQQLSGINLITYVSRAEERRTRNHSFFTDIVTVCTRHLRSLCRHPSFNLLAPFWIQWHCILHFVADTNLVPRPPGSPQLDALCLRGARGLHGHSGRHGFQR